MNNRSINEEKLLQKQTEKALSDFFEYHTGIKKNFKIFSILYVERNRVFITFSSAKRNDKYIETSTLKYGR